MKKYIATILLMFLFFISCSNLEEGEIYEKNFTPAHNNMVLIPITVSTGKSCITTIVPMFFFYPDSYNIKIKKYSKEKKDFETRTVYIDKNKFELLKIGEWYKICDGDCNEPEKIKIEDKK